MSSGKKKKSTPSRQFFCIKTITFMHSLIQAGSDYIESGSTLSKFPLLLSYRCMFSFVYRCVRLKVIAGSCEANNLKRPCFCHSVSFPWPFKFSISQRGRIYVKAYREDKTKGWRSGRRPRDQLLW